MKKIILATLSAGLLVVGFNANAVGQGGIAGSAVMRLSSSAVTHVSSSIAIGKQSAYTGGAGGTGAITATTFASGASGIVTIASGLVTNIAKDVTLITPQANGFDDGVITLDINDATYKGVAD